MITIKHKFQDFQNKQNIKNLILGTFNPDVPDNNAEFFYGRGKNYLWNLLPKVYNQSVLKNASYSEKINFIEKNKIGFVDIIQEIIVENGQETNYADDYIDSKVTKWTDFELVLNIFTNINKVFLTRKTFADVPNMKRQVDQIKQICSLKKVGFYNLPTPARFENEAKLNEWKKIFNL